MAGRLAIEFGLPVPPVAQLVVEDALAATYRQRGDLVAKAFPAWPRKHQQAAVGMLGERELALRQRGEHLAVTRGDGQPSLCVQRQRRSPLKYDLRHQNPPKCTLSHFIGVVPVGQSTCK